MKLKQVLPGEINNFLLSFDPIKYLEFLDVKNQGTFTVFIFDLCKFFHFLKNYKAFTFMDDNKTIIYWNFLVILLSGSCSAKVINIEKSWIRKFSTCAYIFVSENKF